jgi:hypothetical protein
MMKDPFLDWLKHHHGSFVHKSRKYRKYVNKALGEGKTGYNFTSYIMGQGVKFEQKVMKLITKKFTSERVAEIHAELAPRDPRKAAETLEAMLKGVPFIHSGMLCDDKRKTFGIPDLLVRSDWIKFLIQEAPYIVEEVELIPSPTLRRPWHYRVVDIKFTGLLLRADAAHLLNAASFPAYKSQLLIYNWALESVQGYFPNEVYILGRRWRYTSKGETHVNNTCFDKMGIIDYNGLDQGYLAETTKALAWLRDVTTDEAADWNVTKYPLHRWELYPNMCNSHDHPWHTVKQQIADDAKELTDLWMVGPKNRASALAAGVSQWTDPKCTPAVLGITGEKTSRVLHEILRVNRSKKLTIIPDLIENNLGDWKNPDAIEFFVDFETCNGVVSDIKHLPAAKMNSMVFMIGVGYVDPDSGEWIDRDFTVNRLTFPEEERICQEFSTFIREKAQKHGVEKPRCFHWSPAEDSMWDDVVERHDPISNEWQPWMWDWVDLLAVFKAEPIVVKGCMSFSLKEVAAAMKQHGFIETEWDKTSVCIDGQSAMVAARAAHKLARESETSMRHLPVMKEILQYNRVDFRAMYEILIYLRNHHTGREEEPIPFAKSAPKSRKRTRQEAEEPEELDEPKAKRRRVEKAADVSESLGSVDSGRSEDGSDESSGGSVVEPGEASHEPSEASFAEQSISSSSNGELSEESEVPKRRKRSRDEEDDSEQPPRKRARKSSSPPSSPSSSESSLLDAMVDETEAVQTVSDPPKRQLRSRKTK